MSIKREVAKERGDMWSTAHVAFSRFADLT